ncbi:XRE family transcriptional regulator [Bradyrhizobium sp. 87]|uniref:XRE family transcriptional regulator n=1 Tax=Bradyrhizobium sp. 87 TaxID=2782682 RepID=UPI001FFB19B3|nr:XRE family transcriptional regulator [Bradyrhizobium sp. 87]MCK1430881.1 LexA family transcriptional regulator [Bradyrhizobium sp. 87]
MLYHADMDAKILGKRIAEARKAGGGKPVTQAQLANFLGVTPQAVSGWERGEATPETEKISSIANFLQVPTGWLLDGEASGFGAPKKEDRLGLSYVRLMDSVPAGKLAAPMSQAALEQLPLMIFADLGRGDYIALTVEGDSMDRISPDGSIILVNKADTTLVSGKPYVFSHRGKATFKLWRPDPARLQPYSTNPVHEPVYVKGNPENMVVGRVVRTLLDL